MCIEEENTVYYASGYVAMKVMKLFEKLDTPKTAQFVDCTSHMALSGDKLRFLCVFYKMDLQHKQRWLILYK